MSADLEARNAALESGLMAEHWKIKALEARNAALEAERAELIEALRRMLPENGMGGMYNARDVLKKLGAL